jgi:peptide subunit release factor RF-3
MDKAIIDAETLPEEFHRLTDTLKRYVLSEREKRQMAEAKSQKQDEKLGLVQRHLFAAALAAFGVDELISRLIKFSGKGK